MRKEYLEALKSIKIRCHSKSMKYDPIDFDLDIVEKSLKALEAIDNANPSEALECLEHIKKDDFNMVITTYPPQPAYNGITKDEMFTKIEQALLKAQEPKQYLKWEDLEFGKTTHKLKAKMNGSLYRIEWYIDGMGSKVVCLDKYITNDYLIHSACIKDYNQQFFNDLHLERVEE